MREEMPLDEECVFVVSQSLNELLHGLESRADRPEPPGTRAQFLQLLHRLHPKAVAAACTDKEIALSEYAVRIVLDELDTDSEMHPRMGRHRSEVQAVHRRLVEALGLRAPRQGS